MTQKKSVDIPFRTALKKIGFSVFFFSILPWLTWGGYQWWKNAKSGDEKYLIHSILQTGPVKEALKTPLLAEILQLSQDQPTFLYRFNLAEAQEKLLQCPVIKKAHLKRKPPHTLVVDYTLRHPVATVYDYSNTAIDEEGILFPITPFFTPKKLPNLYLGLPCFVDRRVWGQKLEDEKTILALEVLQLLTSAPYSDFFKVVRLDTSMAFADSCGQRQIVVLIEDVIHQEEEKGMVTMIFPRLLRLSGKELESQLIRYLELREPLIQQQIAGQSVCTDSTVMRYNVALIDMRLSDVAYIRY